MSGQPNGMPTLYGNPEETLKILKSLQAGGENSSLLSGGALDEEQQLKMWWFIRANSVMLAPHMVDLNRFPETSPIGRMHAAALQSQASIAGVPSLAPGNAEMVVHSGGQVSGHYDVGHIPQTIVRRATEATAPPDLYKRRHVKFGRREYGTVKLMADWGETVDFYLRAIASQRLNQAVADKLGPRIAHDFEDIAINGDVDIVPAAGDLRADALTSYDGWLKRSLSCPGFSHEGLYVNWAMYKGAIKRMPQQYGFQGFYWWQHPQVWYDWLEYLQSRGEDQIASAAMAGRGFGPMGFPIVLVPMMPIDQVLPIDNIATFGRTAGTRPGPISFPRDGFQLSINVNGAGVTVITFPTIEDPLWQNRLISMERVCQIINDALVAAYANSAYREVARVTQQGCLELLTPLAGAGQSIVLAALAANDALSTLGLTAGTYAGAAAPGVGTTGNLNEGTTVWFAPSWVFNWHVVTSAPGSNSYGLRMFTKYEQDSDEIVTVLYSYQGVTLYVDNALVAIRDLRVARPGVDAINP